MLLFISLRMRIVVQSLSTVVIDLEFVATEKLINKRNLKKKTV
jgi:hypothetical protein